MQNIKRKFDTFDKDEIDDITNKYFYLKYQIQELAELHFCSKAMITKIIELTFERIRKERESKKNI